MAQTDQPKQPDAGTHLDLGGIRSGGRTGRGGRVRRRTLAVITREQLPLVGQRIRELRKEHALTQAALAGRVGIQQSDLCRMETGEYRVALDTLFKILQVFDMNVGEFFLEERPTPTEQVSRSERELLQAYRSLTPAGRDEVKHFIKFIERQSRRTRRKR